MVWRGKQGRVRSYAWKLLPGTLIAVLMAGTLKLGLWQPLENLAYVALFQQRGAIPWDDRLVVLGIDDQSLSQLGRFPWPRRHYVDAIQTLATAQPNVIALDVLFSEPSPDDDALSEALQQHGVVVLAEVWDSTGAALPPVAQLQNAAITTGQIYSQESLDGISRSLPTHVKGIPTLGLAAFQAYTLVQEPVTLPPLPETLWVNWPGSTRQVQQYSFVDLLQGRIDAQVFRNKIVVIGMTATGFDTIKTPFDQRVSTGGVFLHVATLSNLLQNNFLRQPNENWFLLIIAVPILGLFLSNRRPNTRLAIWLSLCLGWLGFSGLMFRANYWFPIAAPIGGLTGVMGAVWVAERLRMNALLQEQIDRLWRSHCQDLVLYDIYPAEWATVPQAPILDQRLAQLTALAIQFGKSQSTQAAIARSLSIGLLATDGQGQIWFCNPMAADVLQVQVGDRVQQALIPHWLSATEWQTSIDTLTTGRSTEEREVQHQHQWFSLMFEPLTHNSDYRAAHPTTTLHGMLLVITNITERHQMERMKDEFVAMVSHELRTPLTSIKGSLGLLLTGKLGALSEKGQRMLEIAITNSDRLLRLINDVLDLERMASGDLSLDWQWCSVADLLNQAAETMQAMADQAQVDVIVSAIDTQIEGDRDRLTQVLTNLLSNAIKFSPVGGSIWLTAEIIQNHRSFSSPGLCITVKDQGRGIPTDKLEAVFERFQQVEATDARQKGGSGLGLAICRTIVEQHGGTIWVESQMNQGSVFYLTLPMEQKSLLLG